MRSSNGFSVKARKFKKLALISIKPNSSENRIEKELKRNQDKMLQGRQFRRNYLLVVLNAGSLLSESCGSDTVFNRDIKF